MERANRTLQDRPVKELRLAGVPGIEAGNALLKPFVEPFNHRFSVGASKLDNLHRALNVAATGLVKIRCHREQRYFGADLTMSMTQRDHSGQARSDRRTRQQVRRTVRLSRQADGTALEGCLSSLPSLQQGPAR